MTVVIGRTHRPCGACGALVDLFDGCAHMPSGRLRPKRAPRAAVDRERKRVAMVDRAALLGALGYPRP